MRDFRNLGSLDVEIPPEGVVIIGDNGHGKTNFLEAIYYLVLFKSFRGARDRELVRFEHAGFFVAGNADVRITAGYEVAGRRKKVTVDGQEIRRLADAVGRLPTVVFSPADREIIAAGPATRRRYMDVLLALSAPRYLTQLAKMRSALKQRNAALRRGRLQEAQAFDAPFADTGAAVAEARHRWVATWRPRYGELSRALGERGTAHMSYHARHHVEPTVEGLLRALGETRDRDYRRGMTTVGPHRDDLVLTLDSVDVRRFGSAGQQRTAAIALRLLEAESLTVANGAIPLALYDDVFAELDADRQGRLLGLVREMLPGQAVLTAPREVEIPPALLQLTRWGMTGGRLVR